MNTNDNQQDVLLADLTKNVSYGKADKPEEALKTADVDVIPANNKKKNIKQSVYGWDRFCFVCDKSLIAKVKTIAEKEGLTIRELMEHMITIGINRYERKNGTVNVDVPILKKKIKDIL